MASPRPPDPAAVRRSASDGARAEPMSPVDAAWLEMDRPHNPMVVAAILEFSGVADVAALGQDLMARLLSQPRFRQGVVERAGRRHWLENGLRPGYHLRIHPLDGPDPDLDLRLAIARELEQDLDTARPLWRLVLFPQKRRRATVLFRAHHAIADGIALLQLLLRLSQAAPAARVDGAPPPPAPRGPLSGVISRLEHVNELLGAAAAELAEDLADRGRLEHQLHHARDALRAMARVAALPDDNPASLRRPLGGRRAVAWTRSLRLATVRRIARMQDVTVNDVFLTALTGAFGRGLRRRGKVREDQNLRVSVPVNLRTPDDGALGNHFGLVLVDLPVGIEGWNARLDTIAERMAALKESPEPRATLLALAAASHLPAAAERRIVDFVGGKAAAVVSNLPGPRERLHLGAARLSGMVFWPPQSGGIGVGVSLLSYAGHVSVGVSADTAVLPEPQRLVADFHQELEEMLGGGPAAAA